MSERSALADRRAALARTTAEIHGPETRVPDGEPPALDPVREAPPAIETGGQRLRRLAHRARLNAYVALAAALSVCLIALAVANTGAVRLHWLVGSGRASLVWIVIASAALGALLGIAISSVVRRKTRPPGRVRRMRRSQAP